MKDAYAVILVDSTSHAIRLEKLISASGMDVKLILVPRHLSSDCGVCVRLQQEDVPRVRKMIQEQMITIQSIEEI